MTEKEFFMKNREREYKTTVRVLEHFPTDRGDFAPHERSQTALQLFRTFVIEERLIDLIAHDDVKSFDFASFQLPATLPGLIEEYKHWFAISQTAISELSDEEFESEIDFFMGTMSRRDAAWNMFFDHIHHRGQLSVYIRMAGGLVPSIYGPSADESAPPKE